MPPFSFESESGPAVPATGVVPSADDIRDDGELLRDYRACADESAFRCLVRRHLPAVWSAARRLVNGDGALAEDISQEVFSHLAIHAAKLPPRVVLGGWLHRHTCFTAAKTLRTASRRRSREQLAADMHDSPSQPPHPSTGSSPWPDLAPHLDAALNALPAADRDAVVLRFFEKRDFPTIAAALGTSEDAVRMRTNRALEKLRRLLGRHQRDGALTVAVLAMLLRENSVAAPPAAAGAAVRVASTALARAAVAPAAAGGAAFLSALRSARPAMLGGAGLVLAVGAAWYLKGMLDRTGETKPRDAAAEWSGNTPPSASSTALPKPGGVDITVDYILVPQSQALSILNQRWNGDGDTELRASLLSQCGSGAPGPNASAGAGTGGIRLANSLTGTGSGSGRISLEDVQQVHPRTGLEPAGPFLLSWTPPVNGKRPEESEFRKVGTILSIQASPSDDGQWCSLGILGTHHYARPREISWPVNPQSGGAGQAPAAVATEFSEAGTESYFLLRQGTSRLFQSSQLPPQPETQSSTGGMETASTWLFAFVTVQPATQP
ncbi:MAG: sigma-70 family RNA polymerase sigma factor [Verrucomicrobiaceae bacterium]|nr:MAG: sigma-70 family RNA polymerase sigma factor [Verrucomicrobiaceae bacterium]